MLDPAGEVSHGWFTGSAPLISAWTTICTMIVPTLGNTRRGYPYLPLYIGDRWLVAFTADAYLGLRKSSDGQEGSPAHDVYRCHHPVKTQAQCEPWRVDRIQTNPVPFHERGRGCRGAGHAGGIWCLEIVRGVLFGRDHDLFLVLRRAPDDSGRFIRLGLAWTEVENSELILQDDSPITRITVI